MGKYTKWILAGLGWAVGGPIGALLGYWIGKAVSPGKQIGSGSGDSVYSRTAHRGPYRNTGTTDDLNAALMVLIAAVMKADGNVRRSELDYVKRFLLANYGEERGKEMLKILQQLVDQPIPIDEVCLQIKVNTDYATRYHMFDFLFGIGGADNEFHPLEVGVLRRIARALGISAGDYTSIYERHVGSSAGSGYSYESNGRSYRGGSSYGNGGYGGGRSRSSADTYSKDPYRVLGIDSSATDDEVKKAYRRMAMKYHPDRVAGMGEEMQRNAAEQMKEINEAYEVIKARRASMK